MTSSAPILLVRVKPGPVVAVDPGLLYDQARKWWKASLARVVPVERVLAVAGGVVIAAYSPERWAVGTGAEVGRVAFEGTESDDARRFLGLDVRHLFPQGSANPVRYASINDLYLDVEPAQEPVVDRTPQPAVLLRLRQTWSPQLTPAELYEATRQWWAMSMAKALDLGRAFAVADGRIQEVYEPSQWSRSPHVGEENRIGFVGAIADDRDRWIGLDVSAAFPRGSQNPVRYVDLETLAALASDDELADTSATPVTVSAGMTPQLTIEQSVQPTLADQLNPLLHALEADLLWSMSRAAQELFHSNTLAWLLANHPVAAQPVRELFDPVADDGQDLQVWREWRSLDLVARAHGSTGGLVVENKLYSVPYAAQLERYTAKQLPWSTAHERSGAADTTYTLLSLMDPSFALPSPWRHVSYEQLLEALQQVDTSLLSEDASLFNRYRGLVRRLVGVKKVVDPRFDLDSPFSVASALPNLATKTFGGHLQRMRYSGLAQAVAELHDTPGLPLHVDLSHSQGSLTYQRELSANRSLGWQLQEGRLRLFVLVRDPGLLGSGDRKAAARAGVADRQYADFVDFSSVEAVLGSSLTTKHFPPGAWRRFAPDFVYRYATVAPETTTGELAQALSVLTQHVDTWGS